MKMKLLQYVLQYVILLCLGATTGLFLVIVINGRGYNAYILLNSTILIAIALDNALQLLLHVEKRENYIEMIKQRLNNN